MREVDVTIDGGIAVVTIDRPQARGRTPRGVQGLIGSCKRVLSY